VEIEKYIEIKLGKNSKIFTQTIFENQIQDLLKIPFYLIHLVKLFKTNYTLPKSKAKIFEQMLVARIQLDVEHFRTTIELYEKRKIIFETLERLALGMETLGRNYITDYEYKKLIPDRSRRVLLKYCTLWMKREDDTVTWEFEHNNFQEYLAARNLSRKSLHIIKDFISFKPDYRKIIPSWVNTLSFLLSISDDHDLLQWILDNEPELAVEFEPHKIKLATRINIFKEIFERYKQNRIFIPYDKFKYDKLARFGESDEIIEFLLNEIHEAKYYTTLCNAINLLGYLEIRSSDQRRYARELLVSCALDSIKGEIVQKDALITLAKLQLNSRGVVDRIVSELRFASSDWVRYGLYYFLHNSDFLDEYIDVFLEGIRYVR